MPIQFRWAFHGQELSSQMGISIVKVGARVSILTIDSIAAGHSGDYTCTASNAAASVNYTASLAVNGSDVLFNDKKTPYYKFLGTASSSRLFISKFTFNFEYFLHKSPPRLRRSTLATL